MPTGRPSMCGRCGECERCKRAAYMREWWANQSPDRKRAVLDRRTELRGDEIRARDRERARDRQRRSFDRYERAHWTVRNAIRDGRLVRQPCEVCGNPRTDAHHDDYSRPLDVRWLCRKHHGEQHRIYRSEAA